MQGASRVGFRDEGLGFRVEGTSLTPLSPKGFWLSLSDVRSVYPPCSLAETMPARERYECEGFRFDVRIEWQKFEGRRARGEGGGG